MKATLLKKALRDIRGHLGAYIACAMLMAIGVIFYSSMTQVVDNIPVVQQQFYEEYRFADAFSTLHSMPASRMERLAALPGVSAASGRLVQSARVVREEGEGTVELRLHSYDPGEAGRLNDIRVTEGAAPAAGQYGIALSQNFYNANALQPGDTLELAIRGRRIRFSVTGCVQTPEYIYIMPEGSIIPDDKNYGMAYVPLDVLESLLGRKGEVNEVSFLFEEGIPFASMERTLENTLSPYGLLRLTPRKDQASHSMLNMEIGSMQAMVSVVPIIFLALGAVVMSVVVKRMVEQQHAQIGLMKAFGYSTREVLLHYALYGVVIGLMASIIGGVLGALVSEYIAQLYSVFFVMPGISGAFSFENVISLSLLALLFGVSASLYGARRVVRLRAAEAMRPSAPPSGRPILLERLHFLWRRLKSATQLSLRNLFRSRARSFVTLLGLMVCYALTAAVFAFGPMIDLMMGDNFLEVQRYDLKISLTGMTDARALESTLSHMQQVDHVEAVLELPLTVRRRGNSKDVTLLALPEGSSLYGIYDNQGNFLSPPKEGVMLTYRTAEALGVRVGDAILLDIPYPDREIHLPVTALCEQYTSNYLLVNRDVLANAMRTRSFATGAMLTVMGDKAALTERLNEAQSITSVADVLQLRDSMGELIATSMSALNAMAFMAIFAGFAIVYNAAVVILSERTRELASLRVLGFTLGETVRVVALEQVLLVLGGILLGLPLTGSIMEQLSAMIESDAFAVPTAVPLSSHLTAALSMVLAWLAAMGITARKVKKTSMVEVLKERE